MSKKINIPITASKKVEFEVKFQVPAVDVKKLLDDKVDFKLIDIRTEPEHKMAKIEGSTLANRDLIEVIFNEWDKDTHIVLYDHTGGQALMAAQSLESKGFTNAKALVGGIDSWSETVDPLIPRYS